VLVVDDSVLMRQAVRRILSTDVGIEVVDIARDGLEALAKIEKLQPDVLTMDVEMPHMDGLSALRLLMERFPKPVVMLSSLTAAGAVPNTSLALVTELFRDWKSPLADGARDVIKWYMPEAQKLARPQRFP